MEDIGDILFYLIAAIIGIAGAIANKRKKKAERTAPQPGTGDQAAEPDYSYEQDGFSFPEPGQMEGGTQYEMITEEDLLIEGSSGLDEYYKGKPEAEIVSMGADKEGAYDEPLAEEFSYEGEPVTDVQISETELGSAEETSLEQNPSWARKLIEDFDLAKAIIYSEVLQRKDFV